MCCGVIVVVVLLSIFACGENFGSVWLSLQWLWIVYLWRLFVIVVFSYYLCPVGLLVHEWSEEEGLGLGLFWGLVGQIWDVCRRCRSILENYLLRLINVQLLRKLSRLKCESSENRDACR